MKKQVRIGTFETNSSSVHTLVICSEKEYLAWKNGELLLNPYKYSSKERFIKVAALTEEEKEEAIRYYEDEKRDYWKPWEDLTEKEVNQWFDKYAKDYDLRRGDYYTYDRYMYNGDLETFEDSYTTESGDKIVAFGKYGYDG